MKKYLYKEKEYPIAEGVGYIIQFRHIPSIAHKIRKHNLKLVTKES